jgi:predicted transcriptional regulator
VGSAVLLSSVPHPCRSVLRCRRDPGGLLIVATAAAYEAMMQRDRKREGLRAVGEAWLIGVSVREYREIEAGDRTPSLDTYQRISELYGCPQTFVGKGR